MSYFSNQPKIRFVLVDAPSDFMKVPAILVQQGFEKLYEVRRSNRDHVSTCHRQQKQVEGLDKENRRLRSTLEAAEKMTEDMRGELGRQQDFAMQASQAKVRKQGTTRICSSFRH